MNVYTDSVPFPTIDSVAAALARFARANNITGPELAAMVHAAIFAMDRTQPGRIQHDFVMVTGPVHPVETGDWARFWPELAESQPITPAAQSIQAPAAINSEAPHTGQEVAHV